MDPWVISASERIKHDEQFVGLGPSPSGLITGNQAKGFLLQSQLPPAVLGQIWSLADHNADGKMDRNEFSVACKLITNKLKGFEVPTTLPPALRTILSPGVPASTPSPAATVPAATPGVSLPLATGLPSQPSLMPVAALSQPPVMAAGLSQPLAPAVGLSQPLVGSGAVTGFTGQPVPAVSSGGVSAAARQRSDSAASQDSTAGGAAVGDWGVPHSSRLKYTQTFNQHDRMKSGYLSGPQARNILLQSGLPNTVLAQIWSLCDIDQDGRLSCEEFVLALHLCERTRHGDKLSNTLPAELIPPSFRRVGRSRTMSTGSQPGDGDLVVSPSQQASFEDRRRENYNKGQAELERRRKLLEDQQRREQEERARKEREEQEKIERARLEQEQRRQEELERQQQRQRELEQQQEEARRRELEHKEAARRELERKRKEEWEDQKRQELESQRQKQQEAVLRLKAQNTQLVVQLNSATDRVKELTQSISDTRAGVTEVKSTIDGMRATRDSHMAQLTTLKAQLRDQNNRLLHANQERAKLEARNKLNDANNQVRAGLESVAMNYDSKQHIIQQQRQRAEQARQQCTVKEAELQGRLHELKEAKDVLNSLVASCQEVHTQLELKRATALLLHKAEKQPHTKSGTSTSPPQQQDWAVDFNSAWNSAEQPTAATAAWDTDWNKAPIKSTNDAQLPAADPWGDGTAQPPGDGSRKVAYTALYSFEGRSADEVSFHQGDIVMINLDANPEPSWLEGEVNGQVGWLPESYVEPMGDSAATSATAVNGTLTSSKLEEQTVPPTSQSKPPPPQSPSTAAAQTSLPTTTPSATDGERYVALYTYESTEPGDLVFHQGDIIHVTEKHGDWWTGSIGTARGIFPSNYVQSVEDQPADQPPSHSPDTAVQSPPCPQPTEQQSHVSGSSRPVARAPSVKKRKGEVAVAVAPYEATSSEQLTLSRGQLVMVRKKSETGWWEGEIQMRGKQRQVGWFPASFVKLKTSRRMSLPDETEPPMPSAQCPGDAPAPAPGQPKQLVVAQFPYTAQNDDELTFSADDVIAVVNKDDTAWWKGELRGVVGLFPSNYVAPQTVGQ